jgi:hypothetical protein
VLQKRHAPFDAASLAQDEEPFLVVHAMPLMPRKQANGGRVEGRNLIASPLWP